MSVSHPEAYLRVGRCCFLVAVFGVWLIGCGPKEQAPSIELTQVPVADAGGPAQMDFIAGRVKRAGAGQRIVVYAHSNTWWVQPTAKDPFTQVQPDQTWKNVTHLGTDYAALLVDSRYQPVPQLTVLPSVGSGVIAVVKMPGGGHLPALPLSKAIRFSGYDWNARTAAGARGGETNFYDPANVSVDDQGYLHLRMGLRDGNWSCAEVNLTRSLGYGSYSFAVRNNAELGPSDVIGMFTAGDEQTDATLRELDVEISRWGNPGGKNAQYVVQPYYVAQNTYRFSAPGGDLTYAFRWEPGSASFGTYRSGAAESGTVSKHVFTSGIPSAGGETVHIGLYDFRHSRNPSRTPVEVVIEKFEYLP
jgi:hypothetical protein